MATKRYQGRVLFRFTRDLGVCLFETETTLPRDAFQAVAGRQKAIHGDRGGPRVLRWLDRFTSVRTCRVLVVGSVLSLEIGPARLRRATVCGASRTLRTSPHNLLHLLHKLGSYNLWKHKHTHTLTR